MNSRGRSPTVSPEASLAKGEQLIQPPPHSKWEREVKVTFAVSSSLPWEGAEGQGPYRSAASLAREEPLIQPPPHSKWEPENDEEGQENGATEPKEHSPVPQRSRGREGQTEAPKPVKSEGQESVREGRKGAVREEKKMRAPRDEGKGGRVAQANSDKPTKSKMVREEGRGLRDEGRSAARERKEQHQPVRQPSLPKRQPEQLQRLGDHHHCRQEKEETQETQETRNRTSFVHSFVFFTVVNVFTLVLANDLFLF